MSEDFLDILPLFVQVEIKQRSLYIMIYTSLNQIKSFNPCASGWKNILKGQNKTIPDDVLFPLTDALESNSIFDILWLIGKRNTEIQVAVRFARMCADSVAHLKNKYAAAAAAAYAAAADAAAADADAYAAYAADAYAAYAAAYADADAYAYKKQLELNKSFLKQCIEEWVE